MSDKKMVSPVGWFINGKAVTFAENAAIIKSLRIRFINLDSKGTYLGCVIRRLNYHLALQSPRTGNGNLRKSTAKGSHEWERPDNAARWEKRKEQYYGKE